MTLAAPARPVERTEARGHRPRVSRHDDGSLRWIECECGMWAGFPRCKSQQQCPGRPARPGPSNEAGVWAAHAAHIRYATS